MNPDATLELFFQEESCSIEGEMLSMFEECLPALESLILRPVSDLHAQQEVRRIEQAKHFGADTVQHLASHTHLLHAKKHDSKLRPKKVLSKSYGDDLCTYENRFLMTLVRRALVFLGTRIKFIQESLPLKVSYQVRLQTQNGLIETSIHRSHDQEGISEQIERLNSINARMKGLEQSALFKALFLSSEIKTPLIPTNLLHMDPDHKTAVRLWHFIHSHPSMGIEFSVRRGICDSGKENEEAFASFLKQILAIADEIPFGKSNGHIEEHFRPEDTFSLLSQTYEGGRFMYARFLKSGSKQAMEDQIRMEREIGSAANEDVIASMREKVLSQKPRQRRAIIKESPACRKQINNYRKTKKKGGVNRL